MSDENVGGLVELLPCLCGEPSEPGVLIHRVPAPHQLRGDLYVVVCSWCGRGAPFVYQGFADSVMPEAIRAWNSALSAHGQPVVDVEETREVFEKWLMKRHGFGIERWADSGEYRYHNTKEFWECWKLALTGATP